MDKPNALVFDLETNDLLPKLTTVHSLAIRDYTTGKLVLSCAHKRKGHPPIEQGLELLSQAEKVFGHNLIEFDIPAIQKVYPGWETKARVWDTLIMVRTRFAHIKESDFALWRKAKLPPKLIGSHSLEAWGHRLGNYKGAFAGPWDTWTPEMQSYCEQDTSVPISILHYLKKCGWPKEAVECEHELGWQLSSMERAGWPFDMESATALQARLAGDREVIGERLRKSFGFFAQPNGKPKTSKVRNAKRGIEVGAQYQNLKWTEFNPGSRDHIAGRLTRVYGWKPQSYTAEGKPQVDESVLKGMTFPEAPDLIAYLNHSKLLGQLTEGPQSWMRHARRDEATNLYRVHCWINSGGTVTHRASHSRPNVAQVPKVGSFYGKESRGLFFAGLPGWTLVGSDMSGLELRCLAHYMARWDDMAYGRVILDGKKEDGTEIHTVNSQILGCERDTGKTWFYAYLYGGGDTKLGSILQKGLSETKAKRLGKEARKKFEGGLPALGYLVAALKKKMKKHGYVLLIDGRRAYVRHEHAVLNTLLQGTGAVLCKHWLVESHKRISAEIGPMADWNGTVDWARNWQRFGWIHDETQDGVREEHAPLVARINVESAEAMTGKFGFRCPLTGESKIGKTWALTH